jgi:hypothetical protein
VAEQVPLSVRDDAPEAAVGVATRMSSKQFLFLANQGQACARWHPSIQMSAYK